MVHEVYTYGDPASVTKFWSQLFGGTFDVVVIRDMCVSQSATRQSDAVSVAKIRQRFAPALLSQFEQQWGNINENWSLTHFLLKYRYVKNWDRELMENYLPLNFESLIELIPNQFDPVFIEHFTLPFIRRRVKRDFHIDMQERTHVKLILEANGKG